MKVVILAGGYGTRISEETAVRPKPMIEIGGKPILWHIMKIYSSQGFNDFVVACGYKGDVIKSYFANYHLENADVTFDLGGNRVTYHTNGCEQWRVTLADTGTDVMTGGRLKRLSKYLDGEAFMMTYGDGVADIDLSRLLAFHRKQGMAATVTAVQPEGRFGIMTLAPALRQHEAYRYQLVGGRQKHAGVRAAEKSSVVAGFREKQRDAWINSGFFVLEPRVLDYIDGDGSVFENGPMERLVRDRQLAAFRHNGFWMCMDTLRDKKILEEAWSTGSAPWKKW